jgi:drug/metabolite transporter (DMT)-like permease
MFALLVALIGIWLLLGAGGWPIPQNIGDVFGILAGMFWALGLTMMRGKQEMNALVVTGSALFFAFIMALCLGIIMHAFVPDIQPAPPELDTIIAIALPLLAFGILILWPSMVGQLWGAKYVAATTAALLTMSEILVATLSTALLEASSMEFVSWIGAGLILIAVLVDLFASKPPQEELKHG